MISFTRQTAWMSVALGSVATLAATSVSLAQATRPASESPAGISQGRVGQIGGDNVYIRSGSHQNYYPVTKLNRGDPVTVVGEEYGWFEILPPAGTFSLVEKTYVDVSGNTGTLNESRWVYAGSNLDNRRYAKQVKLQKGDTVRILGETSDGAFLKIEPPPGATLWVKSDFVNGVDATGAAPPVQIPERVAPGELELDGDLPSLSTAAPAGGLTTRPAGSGGIVTRPPSRTDSIPPRPAVSRTDKPGPVKPTDKYQTQIDAIEAEMAEVRGEPGAEQVYERLIGKLQPIADQSEDEVASLYAAARIKQIQAYVDAQAALRRIDQLREEAIANANALAAERPYRTKPARPADEIVVRGEIRVSGIYEGLAGRPKRWRIVEPEAGFAARTLAYIELPPGSPINPVDYYGRYVGIRASGRQILSQTSPPIPIYTVEEIVVLDSGSRSNRRSGATAYASPASPSVAAPTSQPTGAAGREQEVENP